MTGQDHVASKPDAERQEASRQAAVAPAKRLSSRPFWIAGLAAVAAVGWGAQVHREREARAAETQQQTADFRPLVHVALAQKSGDAIQLILPGNTEAFEQARIFARATGYLAERHVDIGSRVHKGDLLARIAAPDLDQQLKQAAATLNQRDAALRQAEAGVNQARSNKDLAVVTDQRIGKLAQQGWETQQNADQTRLSLAAQNAALQSAQAALGVAQADYQAQVATMQQLQELTGFELVTAPFDGVVTARNVDTGDLISGSASGGTAMFVIARDDVLRVHIDVPQSAAVGLTDGLSAQVKLAERPDDVFQGTVARNAASLNASSRTLSTEVDVKNDAHLLHPGLFVNVAIAVPRVSPNVVVPAGAIVFNGAGLRVATVEGDDTIKMHDVAIYRDFGTSVELRNGLVGGERVVINPPTNLQDGAKVRLADPAGSVPPPAAPPSAEIKAGLPRSG
jgi:RND family efflux transporter MFP subunit